ncbi:MAG: repeat protein [Pseudoduganella sp.]|jgi:hypothetical protein|nr:repeat protein [Pseudoduganella sp.]
MSQASTAATADTLVLHNGKSAVALKAGQANVFKAAGGARYRILRYFEGAEQMLDNVLARRHGADLELQYADGTQVTLQDYYTAAASTDGCELRLPAQHGRVHKLGDGSGAALGDGSTLVYAHGAPDALLALAKGNGALRSTLASLGGDEISYGVSPSSLPASGAVSGGTLGLAALGAGLAAAAAGGGGGGDSSAPPGNGGGTPPPDSGAPRVASIALAASGAQNGTLNVGDVVTVTVTMSAATVVSGTPQCALTIGGTVVQASYAGGSGSNVLRFTYTIQDGQTDANGVAVAANALSLNGGGLAGIGGQAAALAHAAVADQGSLLVDTSAPQSQLPPATITDEGPLLVQVEAGASAYLVHTTLAVSNLASITGASAALWSSAGRNVGGAVSVATSHLADGDYRLYVVDAAGNLSAPSAGSIVIDKQAPAITAVALSDSSGAQGGVLNAGDTVYITVTLNERAVVSGEPQLALQIGGASVLARYASGSGSQQLVFSYQLQAGQADADGIAIGANALSLNGGRIEDSLGRSASLNHAAVGSNPAYVVDSLAPTVQAVFLSGASGAQDGYLNAGDVVSVSVTMSEATTVQGTPQLALEVGGRTVLATYASGSGSRNLVFQYTLSGDDSDSDGIAIAANSLQLHGAVLGDTAGNAALLAHGATAAHAQYRVDTQAPAVTQVAISGASGGQGGVLPADAVVYVQVSLSEAALVTGRPQLQLDIGGTRVLADYSTGSGTNQLVFAYRIQPGLNDRSGIAIPANALSLNGGSLADAAGNAVRLQHAAVADNPSYLVDTSTPSIVSVAVTGSTGGQDGWHNAGDVIQVQLTASEAVYVQGTPRLALNIGGSTVYADYRGGSGSTTLQFSYTIRAGEADANGIAIAPNALSLGSATIRNAGGGNLSLPHAAAADNAAYRVDTVAPAVAAPTVSIGNGDSVTVSSSEAGTVYLVSSTLAPTSVAAIQAAPGHQWNAVSVAAGSATVLPASGLALGTYNVYAVDQAGNLSLASPNLITINALAPAVSSVAISSASGLRNGVLNAGDQVFITVSTTVPASVSGTPQLKLDIGGSEYLASYVGGNGSTALVFSYTVQTGQTDLDGIAIAANGLLLPNGARLQTSSGADLQLNFDAVAANSGYKVDTSAPTAYATGGLYSKDSANANVTVRSSEAGTAYLVHSNVNVSSLASIESGASATQRKSVALDTPFTEKTINVDGLDDGAYNVYTIDSAGNLSLAVSGIQIDNSKPVIGNVTSGTVRSGDIVSVLGNEGGRAYLVSASSAATVAGITGTSSDRMHWVDISANSQASINVAGLLDGQYKVYIIDSAGNVSNGSAAITVDNAVPSVLNVAISGGSGAPSGAGSTYFNANDTITVTVTLSEAVSVSGLPKLALDVGGTLVYATYNAPSGSGGSTTTLNFSYVVAHGLTDANGISIVANSLSLNGGTILDAARNAANLQHAGAGDNAGYKIDTTAPTADVTAGTITTNGYAMVSSNEVGWAYLVHESVDVSTGIAAFTSGNASQWNMIAIHTPGQATQLTASGLAVGNYYVYTADLAHNLSLASTNMVRVTAPTGFAPGIDEVFAPPQIDTSALVAASAPVPALPAPPAMPALPDYLGPTQHPWDMHPPQVVL